MRSFGTNYIINPFDTFALHLAAALQAPGLYVLQEWLGNRQNPLRACLPAQVRAGLFAGIARFGRPVYRRLKDEGIRSSGGGSRVRIDRYSRGALYRRKGHRSYYPGKRLVSGRLWVWLREPMMTRTISP